MTNDDEKIQQHPLTFTSRADGDWLLNHLVFLANTGIAVGITVQAAGFLVSGQLCSGKEYLKEFAEGLAEGLRDTILAETETPAEIIAAFEARASELYDGPNAGKLPPTFIHIRDARYFHPGSRPVPGNTGVLWRGRIAEIAGFHVGKLLTE